MRGNAIWISFNNPANADINGYREYLGSANGNCALDTSKISVHKYFCFKNFIFRVSGTIWTWHILACFLWPKSPWGGKGLIYYFIYYYL